MHPARGRLFVIPGGYRLLVGRDISDAAAFREPDQDRPCSGRGWSRSAIGLLGGTVMSRNMLRRVEQVNRTGERVIAGNLSDRVPLHGTDDEFDQLAANLNGMLDQIERLMTAMREVTDDVAHDLKTPLARLRARLELALLDPLDRRRARARRSARRSTRPTGCSRPSTRCSASPRRKSGARRDSTASRSIWRRSPARRSSSTSRSPRRRGSRCGSTAQPGAKIAATGTCLSQAVANLLDNALKYAGGGEIEIRVCAATAGDAVLEVADRGPGIPEADRESVFDRFVRLEPSRSTPGNGLGLSLVRAIARRHGGAVTLDDNRARAAGPTRIPEARRT